MRILFDNGKREASRSRHRVTPSRQPDRDGTHQEQAYGDCGGRSFSDSGQLRRGLPSRHGGDFVFVAIDQWHHLEGTLVRPRIFRHYFYDDTRPLSASNLLGRIAIADNNGREIGPSIPLVFGSTADDSAIETRVPGMAFTFNVKLFMRLRPNEREQVFDFAFRDYSKGTVAFEDVERLIHYSFDNGQGGFQEQAKEAADRPAVAHRAVRLPFASHRAKGRSRKRPDYTHRAVQENPRTTRDSHGEEP